MGKNLKSRAFFSTVKGFPLLLILGLSIIILIMSPIDHYIDFHCMINFEFCIVLNHKEDTIGKMIENYLYDWEIEKFFTIIVDNARSNDTVISDLKMRVNVWGSDECFLHWRFLRYCAHYQLYYL